MDTIKIEELLNKGESWTKIAKIIGCHRQTVAYYSKKLKQGKKIIATKARKSPKLYNWIEIQEFYNQDNGYIKCKQKFGFSNNAWLFAIKNKLIKVKTHQEIFEINLQKTNKLCSHTTKLNLFKYGFKIKKCEQCLLNEWNGKEIPLELHHIDGNKINNKRENLQILCPNCHAQTSNYGIRNRKNFIFKKKITKICECGNKIKSKKSERCFNCNNIFKRKYNRPTKKELEQSILQKPIREVAKQFGVKSSDCIKKWCAGYGISSMLLSPFSHINRKKNRIVKSAKIYTSKYKNVSFDKTRNLWLANIKDNNKKSLLFKRFKSEIEAAEEIAKFYNSSIELILR